MPREGRSRVCHNRRGLASKCLFRALSRTWAGGHAYGRTAIPHLPCMPPSPNPKKNGVYPVRCVRCPPCTFSPPRSTLFCCVLFCLLQPAVVCLPVYRTGLLVDRFPHTPTSSPASPTPPPHHSHHTCIRRRTRLVQTCACSVGRGRHEPKGTCPPERHWLAGSRSQGKPKSVVESREESEKKKTAAERRAGPGPGGQQQQRRRRRHLGWELVCSAAHASTRDARKSSVCRAAAAAGAAGGGRSRAGKCCHGLGRTCRRQRQGRWPGPGQARRAASVAASPGRRRQALRCPLRGVSIAHQN